MITLTSALPPQQEEWRNDPRIYRWTRQNGPLSVGASKEWLERIQKDPCIKMFGILEPAGAFVGTCGLTSIDYVHRKAEFSCFIAPEHQSKGYGKAALIELFNYGFNHLNLNRIWGETLVGNPALKIFLSLGMKKEGRLHETYYKDGAYSDSIIIGILKEDWEDKRHG